MQLFHKQLPKTCCKWLVSVPYNFVHRLIFKNLDIKNQVLQISNMDFGLHFQIYLVGALFLSEDVIYIWWNYTAESAVRSHLYLLRGITALILSFICCCIALLWIQQRKWVVKNIKIMHFRSLIKWNSF